MDRRPSSPLPPPPPPTWTQVPARKDSVSSSSQPDSAAADGSSHSRLTTPVSAQATMPMTVSPTRMDALPIPVKSKSATATSSSSSGGSGSGSSGGGMRGSRHAGSGAQTSSSTTTTTHSSSSIYTPTIRSPPRGGGSQTKRHSMRSTSPPPSGGGGSNASNSTTLTTSTKPGMARPQSPTQSILSSAASMATTSGSMGNAHAASIHKSLNALDAKSITMNMERSTLQQLRSAAAIAAAAAANAKFHHNMASVDDLHHHASPTSPTTNATANMASSPVSNAYFHRTALHHSRTAVTNASSNVNVNQPLPPLPSTPGAMGYHRQGSFSAMSSHHPNPSMTSIAQPTTSNDLWHSLCVRVLPLFNGEGVQGNIEELNDLLRRCLTDPISPQLHQDIVSLLHDGMFTLNTKMFGVTDEKLLDRLVEQWSFFFTYALPYFEAVFLPLRTDVHYRNQDEADMWNVRTIALQSFRDNVILMQIKRLEDVFNKLFTDFGASQNPAATAAKMLQMTSLLASCPDHNDELDRVLSNLKANWKIMMNKGNRRGFAGVRRPLPITPPAALNDAMLR